jgi:hypothetical protein
VIWETDAAVWTGRHCAGRLRHRQSHCCRHGIVCSGHETTRGWQGLLVLAGEFSLVEEENINALLGFGRSRRLCLKELEML